MTITPHRYSRTRNSAFTISELLIASFLLSLLLATLFVVYRLGAGAWMKADTNAELLGRIQGLTQKIGRHVEGSTYQSLVALPNDLNPPSPPLRPTGCCFISALDVDGEFQFEPGSTLPLWSHAQIFYFDETTGQVFKRKLPLSGNNRFEISNDYILRFKKEPPPSNRIPLPDHFHSGEPMASGIKDILFERVLRPITLSDGTTQNQHLTQLKITTTVEKKSYGDSEPLQVVSEAFYYFRN